MIKIKKSGFTLSEVLIALAVVGVVVALVIAGVIRDIQNRSSMALLQGTVSNLYDVVQNELIQSSARKLSDTDIFNDPYSFLSKFDVAKIQGPGTLIYFPEGGYKSFDRTSQSGIGVGTYNASAILKNGVGIGLLAPRTATSVDTPGRRAVLFSIDLNGDKEPNISGVDLFEIELSDESDLDKGIHAGDHLGYSKDRDKNWLVCRNDGKPYACYSLAVLSGFDPNYLVNF